MRIGFLLLLCLAAAPLKAQDMALTFYDQCVGSAYERQARAKYEELHCQIPQSLLANSVAHMTARRTIELEALDK